MRILYFQLAILLQLIINQSSFGSLLDSLVLNNDSSIQRVYLVKSTNQNRKIDITDRVIKVETENQFDDTSEIVKQESEYKGKVLNGSDTTLSLLLTREKSISYSRNNLVRTYTYSNLLSKKERQVNLNLQNINKIGYQSKYNEEFTVGAILIGLPSLVTTFIAAPLVSINYRTGDFNSKRYYRWASVGLIGISTGISLAYLSDRTKYKRITTDPNLNKRKHWYILAE